MISENELYFNIVNNLSELVKIKMEQFNSESTSPGSASDEMNVNLDRLKKQALFLIHTRAEFETIMTDVRF